MSASRQTPTWPGLLGIGAVAALLVVGGLLLGWVADSVLNTTPIVMFVGLALGIAGACRFMYTKFSLTLND
ncbi:MAG: AtpZ/AtpI family protein [Jatrophihabitans sp.]